MEALPEVVSVIATKETKHCRFCAEEIMQSKLFDWSEDYEVSHNYTIIVEFLKLNYLDLTDIYLPTTICEVCYESFNAAYNFIYKMQQSQIILKSIYNSEVKSEAVVPIMSTENILSGTVSEGEEKALVSWLESTNAVTATLEREANVTVPEVLQNNLKVACVKEHTTQKDHNQTHRQEIGLDIGQNLNDNILLTVPSCCPRVLNFHLPGKETDITLTYSSDLIVKEGQQYRASVTDDKKLQIADENCIVSCAEKNNPEGTYVTTKDTTVLIQTDKQGIDSDVGSNSNNNVLYNESDIMLTHCSNLIMKKVRQYTNKKRITLQNDSEKASVRDNKQSMHLSDLTPDKNSRNSDTEKNNSVGTSVTTDYIAVHDYNQTYRQELDSDIDQNSNENILDNDSNVTATKSDKGLVTNNNATMLSTDMTDHESIDSSTDDNSTDYADNENINSDADDSWASYAWKCLHCKQEFNDMAELRIHSTSMHDKCYAFTCMDCDEQFNVFNAFIEHAREHDYELRYYCQYCNQKFDTPKACNTHTLTHWSVIQKICVMCGEIFPDFESLSHHYKLFKKVSLPKKCKRRHVKLIVPDSCYDGISSWANYRWTCQECCMRMPDVQTLRTHSRDFHNKCFTMKCMDCLNVENNYSFFVKHVREHRHYLRDFCQYCNQKFSNISDLEKHETDHENGPQKPCDGCGESFDNNSLLIQHLRKYDPPRLKGSTSREDKTCDVCGKEFAVLCQLRVHRASHDNNSFKRSVCHICGKSYSSYYIKYHMETHSNKRVICKMCNKMVQRRRIKRHLKSHLISKPKSYTCNECGKQYKRKSHLSSHLQRHMNKKKKKCLVCGKRFYTKTNLKIHMNTHSADSPYYCTHCEKTFNSWGNCNKHMKRKHGDTLAKTKITAQGRLDIDKETGKVVKLVPAEELKEWINEIMTMKTPKQE